MLATNQQQTYNNNNNSSLFHLESLSLTVVEARNLKDTDKIGKADFYIKANIGTNTAQSKVLKSSGLNPKWNETLQLKASPQDKELVVELLDKDTFTKDDILGSVRVPLDILAARGGGNIDQFFPLLDKLGKPTGAELLLYMQPKGSMSSGMPVAAGVASTHGHHDQSSMSKLKNKIKSKVTNKDGSKKKSGKGSGSSSDSSSDSD